MKKPTFFEDKLRQMEERLANMNADKIVDYAKDNKEARTFLLEQIKEGRNNPYYQKLSATATLSIRNITKELQEIDQQKEEEPTKGQSF